MEKILYKIRQDFPYINFIPDRGTYWSPDKSSIFYNEPNDETSLWGLFHELGHAILEHKIYKSDMDLLKKEIAAWGKGRDLAATYNILIGEEYIQNCLDTYRDWLHKRSTCPTCNSHGLEQRRGAYICLNCKTRWEVTPSRFCRPYRRSSVL